VTDTVKEIKSKSFIFIDLLGDAYMQYSINYSYSFKQINLSRFSFRFGVGYYPSKNGWKSIVGIPISIDISNGRKRNLLEIGTGLTFNKGFGQSATGNSNSVQDVHYAITLYQTIRLGYKHEFNNGLAFRVGLTSFYRLVDFISTTESHNFIILPGIGLGYNF
jgi:hypothetical protein